MQREGTGLGVAKWIPAAVMNKKSAVWPHVDSVFAWIQSGTSPQQLGKMKKRDSQLGVSQHWWTQLLLMKQSLSHFYVNDYEKWEHQDCSGLVLFNIVLA